MEIQNTRAPISIAKLKSHQSNIAELSKRRSEGGLLGDVLDVSANNWEKEILQSSRLVVVEFWHKRCQWCKRLGPIYREVAQEYKGKLKFAKINVLENNENRNIAVKYGIMGTPALVFFCEGRALETVLGFQQKERLKQLLDDVIDKHRECLEKSTELKAG